VTRSVPWESTPIDFTDEHAAGWVVGAGQLPIATGKCPRCNHPSKSDTWRQHPECDCECEEVHVGRPNNLASGCGAHWRMRVVTEDGRAMVRSMPKSPDGTHHMTAYKYQYIDDAEFTSEHAASWAQVEGSPAKLKGKCPGCGHWSTHVVRRTATVIAGAGTPTSEEIDTTQACRCDCGTTHPDTPDGGKGCGARWVMRVIGRPGALTVQAEDADTRREDARDIRDAEDAAEAGIGVVTEKWLPGVAALTGIFSLSTAVVSGGSTRGFSTTLSVITFALLVLAIVGATTALVLGYRAAYGWPRELDVSTPEKAGQAATKIRKRKVNARLQLKWAVGLACTAIVFLLFALGFVWFKPGTAPLPTTVRITFQPADLPGATTERCGELLESDAGRLRLAFPPAAGSGTLTVPMNWVQRIEPAACEGM
jgi:hypothetical protein